MNEKRIQQVLDIEKQALSTRDAAIHEAEQLPSRAEQETQALIEKSRAQAEEEARQLVANAHAEEETRRIMEQAQDNIQKTDSQAKSNFNRAVAYTLNQVLGRE